MNAMHDYLPKGWSRKSLEEIGQLFSGATPSTYEDSYWGDEIVWVTPNDLSKLKTRHIIDSERRITQKGLYSCSAHLLPKGSLVISSRAPIGYMAIAQTDFCTNQGCKVLVLSSDQDPDFHYYNLSYRVRALKDKGEGTTFAEISKAALGKIVVPVPEAKAEQTAIAEVLATVDRAIAQSEALIAKQRRIKAGLLHDLLTRGIDAQGNLRHPSTHQFKSSPVGPVPEEWEVGLLDTVAEIGSGVTLGRSVSGSDVVEMPYLRVANVQDGYIDLSDIKTVHIYRHEIPRFLLQPGDVLMNEGGDFDKLGRGAVWRGQIAPCLHQNHVFRVRANPTRLLPDFLALVSASPYGRRFFIVSSKQSTNLASINSTQLKSFPVPLPSIEEQETIVEILGVSDAAVDAEDTRRLKLQRLKTGLMQDLLSGRVSVTGLVETISARE